ncbi:MAG: hypothetical protein GY750_00505 [Lentisphaerae bacterium]|nr:hypothetical protein [Lentisphaerota bacterium]MCP4099901.1 hypothetical protein [Lentisphaerota bacterium]
MNKKEISFLGLIVLGIVIFFITVTPTSSSSRKKGYNDYPVNWQKTKDDPTKHYDISGIMLYKEEVALRREKLLEKLFNVNLHYRYLSREARDRKMPLMLAAGNVPDFFMCPNKFIRKFSQNGYLMQVPYKMMVKYAPHLVKLINDYQPNAWQCTMDANGKNWGIPFLWAEGLYPRVGVWRVDWLHKVGIKKIPNTLQEMHEALRRFTYDDPDGNGVRDTYGMSGDIQYTPSTFTEVFGAYGSRPYCWIRKNGKPVWGGIQPEAKMALRTLRAWYKEGLIHPDFLTDDVFRQSKQKFANGKTGYLNYSCWYENFDKDSPTSLASMTANLQPGSEIAPGTPPYGPAKQRMQQTFGVVHYYSLVFGRHMAKTPAKVIRILKMFDRLYADQRLFIEAHIGIKGKHWDWADKKVGPKSGAVLLEPYRSNTYIRDAEGLIQTESLLGVGDPKISKKYLPAEKLKFNEKYRNSKWGIPSIFYYLPHNEKYSHDLLFLQKRFYGEIIKGEVPLSAFDKFKELWLKQGGAILTAEAQDMDDRMHKVFNKLGIKDKTFDEDHKLDKKTKTKQPASKPAAKKQSAALKTPPRTAKQAAVTKSVPKTTVSEIPSKVQKENKADKTKAASINKPEAKKPETKKSEVSKVNKAAPAASTPELKKEQTAAKSNLDSKAIIKAQKVIVKPVIPQKVTINPAKKESASTSTSALDKDKSPSISTTASNKDESASKDTSKDKKQK